MWNTAISPTAIRDYMCKKNQPATTVNKTFNDRAEVMLAIACPSINLSVSGIQYLCGNETLDAIGRLLTEETGSNQLVFDLGQFEAGLYFITTEFNGNIISKKIIRE